MALTIKDRVKEATTVTGTGAIPLGGSPAGFQAFSTIGNGNSTYYSIYSSSLNEWEVGVGTYAATTNSISRDTVLSSSNSGALVSFSAGLKEVICTLPASVFASTQTSFSAEVQTATAGQTVFVLTSLVYNPGANSLAVYVNGLCMVGGVDYIETAFNTVTFTSGLALADQVLFIGGRTVNDAIGAEAVSYIPAGTGAVATSVRNKLRETVSVKDFGAVGDGVTDDAAAIQAAVNAAVGKMLYFPAGTYIIGTTISLPTNTSLEGDRGVSILKLRAQDWPASNGLMFSIVSKTDVQIAGLVVDGNKGFVGTTRSPIIVAFNSQQIAFYDNVFQNAEGICLNISTDADDLQVKHCSFYNCGGNPDNSDGYRNQAIAFSSTAGTTRSKNVIVEGCYFYRQGLDCISLSDCDNVSITGNTAEEGYTLLYNNPLPKYSTNLIVENNIVRTCSEFGAGTIVPPAAMDLPSVKSLVVSGNAIYDVDQCGIGIFEGTENAVVSGNLVTNPMRAGVAFNSGICVLETCVNINIEGNTIIDTAVTPLMRFGIVVYSNDVDVNVKDNIVKNPLISRYGYFTTDPFVASTFAFTSSAQVSSSTRIVDLDVTNNLETTHGRLYVQHTDSTNPAVRITQLGTANAIVVEDSAADSTFFAVDANGNVGVAISPATFGGPLSVSGTGGANITTYQAYGADAASAVVRGAKTRGATPYTQGLVSNNDLLLSLDASGSDGVGYRSGATLRFRVDGAPAAGSMPTKIVMATSPTGTVSPVDRLQVTAAGDVQIVSASGGLGYGTGAGGAVVQITSKTTGVTLNKPVGKVTLTSDALAANAVASIVVTNSVVAVNDVVIVNLAGGVASAAAYNVWASTGVAGAFSIHIQNISAVSLSEAAVINFAVFRGAIA